jgi:hypothetical protein
VNGRKEFFRANIREIESVIRENYDAVVEVTHEAPAEQYRESLRMAMPAPAIQHAEHAVARGQPAPETASGVVTYWQFQTGCGHSGTAAERQPPPEAATRRS